MNIKSKKLSSTFNMSFGENGVPVLHNAEFNVDITGTSQVQQFLELFDLLGAMTRNDMAVYVAHEIVMLHRSIGLVDEPINTVNLVNKFTTSKLYPLYEGSNLKIDPLNETSCELAITGFGFIIKFNSDISRFIDLFDIYHSIETHDEAAIKAAKAIVELQHQLRNQGGLGKIMVLSTPQRVGDSEFDKLYIDFKTCNPEFRQLSIAGLTAATALTTMTNCVAVNTDCDCMGQECPCTQPDELPESMAAMRDEIGKSPTVEGDIADLVKLSNHLSESEPTHEMYHALTDELQIADDRRRVDTEEIANLKEALKKEQYAVKKLSEAKERSPCNWHSVKILDGVHINQGVFDSMTKELVQARRASFKRDNAYRELTKVNDANDVLTARVTRQLKTMHTQEQDLNVANTEARKADETITQLKESVVSWQDRTAVVLQEQRDQNQRTQNHIAELNLTIAKAKTFADEHVAGLDEELADCNLARKHFKDKYEHVCKLVNELEIKVKIGEK